MIGGKFAPLTIINNEDTDMDSMITTFNITVTETAGEILCKHRQTKRKPGSLQKGPQMLCHFPQASHSGVLRFVPKKRRGGGRVTATTATYT